MSQGRRRSPLPRKWPRIRRQVLDRDAWQCQIREAGCTGVAEEVDHIDGHDDHSRANLQAVCRSCHARKTGREAAAARGPATPPAPLPPRRRPAEPHPGDTA